MTNSLPLAPPLESDISMQTLGKLAERLGDIDLSVLLIYLVDIVDRSALPWLGEQFSMFGDGWELAESDEARRALVKSAIELHRYKGTPWSIRQVIRNLGFGEVELYEGEMGVGPSQAQKYPGETRWALYRIKLAQTITNDQAALLRTMLAAFAPARCTLTSLDFVATPIRYNNTACYDGKYNHGSS